MTVFMQLLKKRHLMLKSTFMKRILFMMAPLIMLVLAFRPVISHTITGKVTDESGNPLAGVAIREKGTKTGTISSADGSFQVNRSQSCGKRSKESKR
jgi:Ca-activated chloride channel family protein